jgi:hypothetical protein
MVNEWNKYFEWEMNNKLRLFLIILVSIISRIWIGLGKYSGYNNSPIWGDMEC